MNVSDWLKRTPQVNTGLFNAQTREQVRIRKQVRLSVVTQFFPPDYAPTGQLIEELVRQLDQPGVDIEVFTGQPGYAFQTAQAPATDRLGRVRVKRSRSTQVLTKRIRGKALNGVLFSIRALFYLLNACRHRNLALLTTAPPFLPILGYVAHLLFGLPYVCLLYDLYPDIAIELGVVSERHWLAQFWREVNRKIWRRAQGIIVLSPAMKERVVSHCPEVADKVSVIHSWANPDWIVPIPKHDNWFAQRHNLVDRFTVLYSGNMGRCHDIDTILQAAIQLQDEPIQFVCIGDGANREVLIQKANQLELRNILFLPYQDRKDLPYSLTACDLSLVSVQGGMESLVAPSKLYPALSTGRPIAVICPPHSYLNELVTEAGCGASFANGDGVGLAEFIRQLASDRRRASRMGAAGREYMQANFTPNVIARDYLKVIRQSIK